MPENSARYIPVLSFRWLTPLYDPFLRWVMQEEIFKRRLLDQAALQPGMRVLDLGCGIGSLTIMIKQTCPDAEVTGLDGDPQVLSLTGEKAARAGVSIAWDEGLAYELAYPDQVFDRVLTSLVLHHLSTKDKLRAFRDILRVLKPDGEFHIADFGSPHSTSMSFIARYMRHLEEADDDFDGKIP